jgi:primase-polymerase (primpol)-like protein
MSDRCCEECGGPLRLYRSQARTCSARCRKRLSRRHALPAALTERARWVRRTFTKRPITVTGKPASSTDPATWATFAEAKGSSAGVGLGFVLGDGIGCVDLDHCLDGGVLADWAADYIRSVTEPVIFAEVSQSGEGVHLFIEAQEAPGRKIRDGRNIERYTVGRYIAVTGIKLTI